MDINHTRVDDSPDIDGWENEGGMTSVLAPAGTQERSGRLACTRTRKSILHIRSSFGAGITELGERKAAAHIIRRDTEALIDAALAISAMRGFRNGPRSIK